MVPREISLRQYTLYGSNLAGFNIFIQKALKHTNICLPDDKITITDAGLIPSLSEDFDKTFDDHVSLI